MCSEAGVSGLSLPLVSVSGDFSPGMGLRDSLGSSSSAGFLECPRGQGLSGFSDLHGVVAGRPFFPAPLRPTWPPAGGLDGYFGECQDLHLHLSLSGRQGLGVRRSLLRLGPLGIDLSFPSVPAPSGGGSAVGLLQGHGVSRGSSVGFRSLVSPAGREMSSQTSPPRGPRSLPVDFRGLGGVGSGGPLPTSRLDFMRRSLSNDGFSSAAVDYFFLATNPLLSPSTSVLGAGFFPFW